MLNFKKVREFHIDNTKEDFEDILGIDRADYVAKMAYVTKLLATRRHDPMEMAQMIGEYMTLEELVLSTLSLAVMAGERTGSMLDKKMFKMPNNPEKVGEMLEKIQNAKSEEEITEILKSYSAKEVNPGAIRKMIDDEDKDDQCPDHSLGTDN